MKNFLQLYIFFLWFVQLIFYSSPVMNGLWFIYWFVRIFENREANA